MTRKNYGQELVRRSTGREVADLLRELYVDKRHSQQEIADALGITRAMVYAWLAEAGITRADREPVSIEAIA